MNAPVRLLIFVAGCAAVFAVALGVGRVVGPVASDPAEAAGHGDDMTGGETTGEMDDMEHHDVGGLESAAGGYQLTLADGRLVAGRQQLAFTISGPDGHPVKSYDEQHERLLHLVVVRRDLTGFQHLHPDLDPATGEWSTEITLEPGAWRVLADFVPTGGPKTVLGSDLLVPGDFEPEPLGADSRVDRADGYEVTLERTMGAYEETVLTARVTKDDEPVTDLEPYLGAYGHLVALREGDLGYVHVHPEDDSGPGPDTAFRTVFPSAGRYRLFLEFQHGGAVHLAAFTVTVDDH